MTNRSKRIFVARWPRAAGNLSGFTLIELMAVLVIIGLMSAMIIPEMRGTYQDALLRSSSRELMSVFDLAGSQAIAANQLHRVRLDPGSGKYVIERSVRDALHGTGFEPVKDLPGGEGQIDSRISVKVRQPGEDLSEDANAQTTAAARDNSQPVIGETIGFYADGTADPRDIILRDHDGFRIGLHINPITARVHIVELERK